MDEEYKEEAFADVIKHEGDKDALVWKHPKENFRMGAQLIVHESQEAVFFRDGQVMDLFCAGRHTLETQQAPFLAENPSLPADSETTFHSEVYYINMATQMGVKWGTDSRVRLLEPVSGLPIEIGASGEFNIRVTDSRKLLLRLVGTESGLNKDQLLDEDGGRGYFRALVIAQVKSRLAQAIKENNINILEIDAELLRISEVLKNGINETLDAYGMTISEFYINRIITPDEDPGYRQLKELHAQQYLLVRQEEIKKKEAEAAAERREVEAQTEAKMKTIAAQGDAEALKIRMEAVKGLSGAMLQNAWDCPCGQQGNAGNFCSNCGRKRE